MKEKPKPLGIIGSKLMYKFIEVLGIEEELANEIINRNLVAYSFINDEECLNVGSLDENLNILLGITLFRDPWNYEELTTKEIKILKESYNIEIKIINEFGEEMSLEQVENLTSNEPEFIQFLKDIYLTIKNNFLNK